MCVCSLNCCSVAIVTTFPISLLIQTGLKLRLVAALLPHYHRSKHELSPSSPPVLTPMPTLSQQFEPSTSLCLLVLF